MLLWLSHWLSHSLHFLRVFNYLTFRSIVSTLTALFIMLFFGPTLIKKLTFMSIGQSVRGDGPQTHLGKAGTPTMGGALILISISISVLLWCDLTNIYVWLTLLTMLSFGLIGFVDDYKKLVYRNSKGLAPRWKLIWQVVFAVLWVGIYFHYAYLPSQTALYIPFFKNMLPDLGVWSAVLALLVIVGSSNAVNLTDGLDGLAILPTVLIAFALAIFSYLTGNAIFANYLAIPFVPGSGELAVFCSTVVGAGLGFLWFNTYPAQVFMGDVGSLGLGAMLGMIAVLVRQEIVFMVMGGVFVMETISVILQVASFKLTGKRIFKMAPLHHHFELKGWPEPRVIVRFWIVTFILVLCGLATLKLR